MALLLPVTSAWLPCCGGMVVILGRLASRGERVERGDELGRLKGLGELVRVDLEGGGLLLRHG